MRDRTTIAALFIALLSVLILSCPLFAWVDFSSPWPGYHFGTWRDGWNKDCQSLNPYVMMPIWTFPRMDDEVLVEEQIVDDIDADFNGTWDFRFLGDAWNDRYRESIAVYNPRPDGSKKYPPPDTEPIPPKWNVRWTLPAGSPAGAYRIYIWVPATTVTGDGKSPTKYAHYRVIDADVANPTSPWSGHMYEKDQSDGGRWIALADKAFRYNGTNPLFVELNQYAKDALHDQNPINNPRLGEGYYGEVYLIADAVKFVQDTDREIWASPAAGSTAVGGTEVPVIYVGVREGSRASHTSITSLGAMYSVLSIQDEINTTIGSLGETDVGTPIWKYPVPADPTDRQYEKLHTRERHELEGPIGSVLEDREFAGIYSSPIYFQLPEDMGSTKVVAFGASDRQVYCLDAETGALLWKGPGETVTEGNKGGTMWPTVANRNDAFGGSYMRMEATPTNTAEMVWERTTDPSSPRAAYAIYAWLPGKTAGEERVPDATYEITYTDDLGNTHKDTVTVKMDDDDTQGVWVRLGDSYWEPVGVKLFATTKKTDPPGTYYVVADAVMFVPEDVKNFSYSSPMVTLEYDPSSNPPRDSIRLGTPYRLLIGNTGGRVYAFDLRSFMPGSNDKRISLAWVYPKTKTMANPTKPDNAGDPALGPITSSIAIEWDKNVAYFTCGNGRVYKLGDIGGTYPRTEWVYPNPNNKDKPDQVDTALSPFTASPAVSMNYVYAACSDGYLYRFSKDGNTSKPIEEREPNQIRSIPLRKDMAEPNVAKDELALGAFRYATPAVIQDASGIETVYVASTDGRVYAFESYSNGLTPHKTWIMRPIGTDDYRETAFSTWAPMQAAPCVDGGYAGMPGSNPTLYVACQNGAAYWLDTRSANYYSGWQTEAYENGIFASPVVANSYLYVAATDGRVYAFSPEGTGAFGGRWVGGGEGPPGSKAELPSPSGDSVHVDIFSNYNYSGPTGVSAHAIYQETLDVIDRINSLPEREVDPETQQSAVDRHYIRVSDLSPIGEKGIWRANEIMEATEGSKMQSGHKFALRNSVTGANVQHFLEWGEEIYVLAWNIDELSVLRGNTVADRDALTKAKKSQVTFRLYNASAGSSSGMLDVSKPADFICEYETRDAAGNPVKRCVAGAKILIAHGSDRPQSPGYGWVLTCTVRLNKTTSTTGTSIGTEKTSVVPELTGSPNNYTMKNPDFWVEQKIGINNPLGIRAQSSNGLGLVDLGWIKGDGQGMHSRGDVTAHFNGNTGEDTSTPGSILSLSDWPILPFGSVDHGTDSDQRQLGVVDRSATGLIKTTPKKRLDRFRLQNRDLHWLGGASSVLFGLPWDWPPPYQRDYPDIYKRYESFQQEPDGADPSAASTALLPVIENPSYPGSYDYSRLVGQPINATVRVPKFQPANLKGYGSRNFAFIDSNNNGVCETGDVFNGPVSTRQEAYREFDMGLVVPPDFRMTVEESTIDIGAAPHGLGIGLDSTNPFALYAGNSYTNPAVDKWFKPVTVKNHGNVNLYALDIDKINLFSDSGDLNYTIPGYMIRSSLDATDPLFGVAANLFKPATIADASFGATISKARVGEVDPTILTLPDSRPYSEDPVLKGNVEAAWQNLLGDAYPDQGVGPVLPKVSVGVPLSQPRGIYGQQLAFISRMPLPKQWFGSNPNNLQPLSQRFVMTVDVREDRMTDGFTPGALPMIDKGATNPSTGGDLAYGDVQPAAWRDKPVKDTAGRGGVHLLWSSNRFGPDLIASPNDPWYLFKASLEFDHTASPAWCSWKSVGTSQWWQPTTGTSGWLKITDPWPGGGNIVANSIKHTSPFVAVDNDPVDESIAWLFWQGQADYYGPGSDMKREYRIFYTNATGGNVVAPGDIYWIGKDPSQVKMQPRASTYLDGSNRLMWLFWYGGSNGRWNIYYSQNTSPSNSHDASGWSQDNVLTTPAALASVSEPTPIRRRVGTGRDAKTLMDVVYTGLFKQGQNSDVMLTRYETEGSRLNPRALPRQYGEVLKRDTKRNVFQSAHIGWIKPALKRNNRDEFWDLQPVDRWYTADPNAYLNYPYIKVIIPVRDQPRNPKVLFATNGAMPAGTEPNQAATLAQDAGSGTYVYSYASTDERSQYLGQMIVDPSAGIVRFTKTLPAGAKVVAEYTPQTLRLTQGSEADTSPYALLEKTENMNPGFYPMKEDGTPGDSDWKEPSKNTWRTNPVDRLWVFWRKPNTSGVQTSTIYYKTYRLTLNMPKDFPIAMETQSVNGYPVGYPKPVKLTVTGNVGPYEVDPTGTKIYFTERDEKYFKGPGMGGDITVTYTAVSLIDNTRVEKTVRVDGLVTPVEVGGVFHGRIVWEQELPHDKPDQALLGWGADTQKNEGQVCAFADIASDTYPWYKSPWANSTPTRIWVFWMSTRAGNTDLYYETICPSIGAKKQ